jgi:hypothetical protein
MEPTKDFIEKINLVRKSSMGVPKSFQINLGVALNNQPYDLSGNAFYIWDAPDAASYILIRVNETREPAIPFRLGTGLTTPFYRLFITTPAGQAGTMTIIYGTEAPDFLDIIDNRSGSVASLDDLLSELRGDVVPENWGTEITVGNAAAIQILAANANRKACIIQAKSTNTGLVYIGFDNTVATNKWIAELQAGMAFSLDDYRGDLYARANAAGQLVGYGEW